jgi:predicted small lipoprotein YifL
MISSINTVFRLFILMTIVAALALPGCGKKGELEPPDGKEDEFPRQYPDPSTL